MKIQTFDPEIIRQLMMTSPVLEHGIEYYILTQKGLTRDMAQECAVLHAQQECQYRWYNDSTGYICNEYRAFEDFKRDVDKGFVFYTSLSGRCPFCGSKDIRSVSKLEKALTCGVAGIFAIGENSKKLICNKCNKRFD